VVRDKDRLDEEMAVGCEYWEEVLDGTVLGALTVDRCHGANLEVLRQ
jgi:hypothetical protein